MNTRIEIAARKCIKEDLLHERVRKIRIPFGFSTHSLSRGLRYRYRGGQLLSSIM